MFSAICCPSEVKNAILGERGGVWLGYPHGPPTAENK